MSEPEVGALIEEAYGELHRIADGYLRREQHKSVQATELINEVYLRMARTPNQHFQNRALTLTAQLCGARSQLLDDFLLRVRL